MKPRTRRSEPGAAGFTLIELLVGIAVMAGVLAGAYLCLDAGLGSQKLIESRRDVAQSARVALALLAADLRAACPLSADFELLGMDRELGGIEADNIDFATHNWRPRAPGEGDFCEVSWFVDTHPESGGLALYRRRDPSPDDQPLDGGSREEIVSGVRGFRLEYFDGFGWYDTWGSEARGSAAAERALTAFNLFGLPEAVRITLSLAPPGAGAAEREGMTEPPLAFQTVVRLELQGRASRLSASGSGTQAGTEPSGGDRDSGPAAEGG
jgi:type II secretion system protein J